MAWPTPVQITMSASGVQTGTGSPFSMTSNATVGNSVLVFLSDANTAGNVITSVASSFGTATLVGSANGSNNFPTYAYLIPVTSSGSKTITPTGTAASTWYLYAVEMPGSVTTAWTGPTGSGANPTATIACSQTKVVFMNYYGASAATAIAYTPATSFTDTNANEFTWAHGIDVAYGTPASGTTAQITWTAVAGNWQILAVVLTQTALGGDAGPAQSFLTLPPIAPLPIVAQLFGLPPRATDFWAPPALEQDGVPTLPSFSGLPPLGPPPVVAQLMGLPLVPSAAVPPWYGAGAGSFSFSAPAAPSAHGSVGLGTFTFAASSTAHETWFATGAASFTFTGSATGLRTAFGTGTGSFTFTGHASAAHGATGAATFVFNASPAFGNERWFSTGTASFGFATTGTASHGGAGHGTFTFTGLGAAHQTWIAHGTASFGFVGAALSSGHLSSSGWLGEHQLKQYPPQTDH